MTTSDSVVAVQEVELELNSAFIMSPFVHIVSLSLELMSREESLTLRWLTRPVCFEACTIVVTAYTSLREYLVVISDMDMTTPPQMSLEKEIYLSIFEVLQLKNFLKI
ncbi:hypothetical protein J6590_085135 [Homalodisca vitripennis]|nr:hypothetical protein J6590_085135 [Homalodisca vitripennis]